MCACVFTHPCRYNIIIIIIYDCDRVDLIVHGKVFGSIYADKSVSEHDSDPLLVNAHKVCCLQTSHLKRQREVTQLHSHWETHDMTVDTVTWCHLSPD